MLIAAATVKDSPAHLQRFVSGNLAGGLDHLVVFLDQPGAPGQDEAAELLEAHPHVTCVRAGPRWWGEHRPAGLNQRQCTNASVVLHLLEGAPDVEWVFHVDGDEVVRLDESVLGEVPAHVPAVRLVVREAVSKLSWDGEPTSFKRRLDEPELRLLHLLGVLPEPSNQAYFHGHLQGKSGARPTAGLWLGLHKVLTADAAAAPTHDDERLELFHYESYSGEEFARKWSAMMTSGPRPGFRSGRAAVADAVWTLLETDLPPQVRHATLLRLFKRTTLDDAATLTDLGLVLETDPLAGTHRPRPVSEATLDALHDGLARLRGTDKGAYFVGASPRGDAARGDARGNARGREKGRRLLGRAT